MSVCCRCSLCTVGATVCTHAAPLIHAVNAQRRHYRRLWSHHLPTLASVRFCPIDGAWRHYSESEVCPPIDKWRLGCSGLRWSPLTREKPAGHAGAFTIFLMPFTRMERGSSEVIWVTGNETGFREICTADTPATEVLLKHVRTRKQIHCNFSTLTNSTASILTCGPTLWLLLLVNYSVGLHYGSGACLQPFICFLIDWWPSAFPSQRKSLKIKC